MAGWPAPRIRPRRARHCASAGGAELRADRSRCFAPWSTAWKAGVQQSTPLHTRLQPLSTRASLARRRPQERGGQARCEGQDVARAAPHGGPRLQTRRATHCRLTTQQLQCCQSTTPTRPTSAQSASTERKLWPEGLIRTSARERNGAVLLRRGVARTARSRQVPRHHCRQLSHLSSCRAAILGRAARQLRAASDPLRPKGNSRSLLQQRSDSRDGRPWRLIPWRRREERKMKRICGMSLRSHRACDRKDRGFPNFC